MESKFERLSNTCVVKSYTLEFLPNASDRTFHGNAKLCITLTQPTSELVFNAKKLQILSAKVHHTVTKSDSTACQESITYNESLELVTIGFESLLQQGDVELSVAYKGILGDDMQGFYRSTYTDDNNKTKTILCTQFEPTYARRAFPCLDEPNRKAVFEISLVVQDHLTSLSNMPEVCRTPVENPPDHLPKPKSGRQYVRVKFAPTPCMSTYIVAFVIGQFDSSEVTDRNNVLIKCYTAPNKSHLGAHALKMAKSALPLYTDIFGTGYPLPKLDLIAIPDFAAGAMENWGLVTYRETALCIDDEKSSLQSKRNVALTVAHELAHMWFGNLVTMEWWTHLWLNEGFATWIEYLAVDHCFPEYDIWTSFLTNEFYAAMQTDQLKTSHPIEVVVNSPNEVEEIFDAVSYEKGSSIIRMLNDYLGPETFKKGLQIYINRHKFSNTVTEDLWRALSEASGEDVEPIMSTWTKQTGFPVLTVRPCEFSTDSAVSISIEQTRFLADGSKDGNNADWSIPVTICEAENSQNILTKVIVPPRAQSKDLPFTVTIPTKAGGAPPKIRLNPGAVGFYRVQYEGSLMGPILDALGEKKLSSKDRLCLLADTFALARAGRVQMPTALTMASTFRGERDYTIWCELREQLKGLQSIIQEISYTPCDEDTVTPQTPAEVNLDLMIIFLAKETFNSLGWQAREKESNNDTLLRPLLIGLLGAAGYKDVVEEARKRFERHCDVIETSRKGDSCPMDQTIPADLRVAVYSTCMRHGGEEVYEKLLNLLERAEMSDERVRIYHAIGHARHPRLAAKVVSFAFSDSVRRQDRLRPLMALSASATGRRAVWQAVQSSIDTLGDDLGATALTGYVLKSCCEGFCSQTHFTEIESFFAQHPVPCARAVQQALESISCNIRLMEREGACLPEFLRHFVENIPECY